ncbi:hypothetical protein [Fimbriimonas ginsengisoli]|uniref:Uncharacterized protein n=1 Tax=Fimbriimonas ginsengisoli Gsoil 348 TaxID=661478 RepID=A0A068NZ85_FIMGI|nr:hypothetical protein [Fimbriimonas ginsengisoli]AIE88134.1 hypothetical protein OP10G_4766 [Fimbriimonas ginsengisoli Gsoil 348]
MEDVAASADFKLGRHEPGAGMVAHRYANVYHREKGRLVIAPKRDQIGLFLALARQIDGPFRFVYVLLGPFGRYAEGRYELSVRLDHESLELLLDQFRLFFQGDARHHVFIGNDSPEPLLFYDQHDLIYAYGPAERYVPLLESQGLTPGVPEMPSPHSHHIRPEFDVVAEELLSGRDWKTGPLLESD